MRSNPIKTGHNQERSLRTTNNIRNTELTGNKLPLNSNGESVYGHSISGFVATQTPITIAATVGNEFAGYELNYENSVNYGYNNNLKATDLINSNTYSANKIDSANSNQEKFIPQLSKNIQQQKYIPTQIQNKEFENDIHQLDLANPDIPSSPTLFTAKNSLSDYHSLAENIIVNNASFVSSTKDFHKLNTNLSNNQNSSTNLQFNEQTDHKISLLFNTAKQQAAPAFSLVHFGSTLPELTNNFTSFATLADSIKNINLDSNSSSELSDTLISSVLSQLSAKNLPNVENVIYTGLKNAVLTGNGLSNVLIGSTGNDILNGGKGEDKLIGGDGNDYFVFSVNEGNDQILDFNVGDRILLKGSINLNELSLSEDASGQILSINGTTINLVGISDLTISTDWIGFIK